MSVLQIQGLGFAITRQNPPQVFLTRSTGSPITPGQRSSCLSEGIGRYIGRQGIALGQRVKEKLAAIMREVDGLPGFRLIVGEDSEIS